MHTLRLGSGGIKSRSDVFATDYCEHVDVSVLDHISIFSSHLIHRIMSTDKELYKLELLSLVAQVSQELFNHTKLQDKNLAEFVIAVS